MMLYASTFVLMNLAGINKFSNYICGQKLGAEFFPDILFVLCFDFWFSQGEVALYTLKCSDFYH